MIFCEFFGCLILGDTWEAYADVDRGKSNLVNNSFFTLIQGFSMRTKQTFDLQRVGTISLLNPMIFEKGQKRLANYH